MIVVIIGNEPYSHYCQALVSSLIDSGTKIKGVHVACLGEWRDFKPPKLPNSVNWVAYPLQGKKAYCANIRATIMLKVMLENKSDVLYLDADSLVRGDITHIGDFKGEASFLLRTKSRSLSTKVASGVVYVKYSKVGIKFLRYWKFKINRYGIHKWYTDQKALYRAFVKYEKHVSPLSSTFIDWSLSDKGLIWTAKGSQKRNKVFIEEKQKWK